jgi:hypothetical protein
MNQLVRIARISKLYKLAKVVKLFRLIKLVKKKKEISAKVINIMKSGAAVERLVFFVILLLLMSHLAGCLWIFAAVTFEDPEK